MVVNCLIATTSNQCNPVHSFDSLCDFVLRRLQLNYLVVLLSILPSLKSRRSSSRGETNKHEGNVMTSCARGELQDICGHCEAIVMIISIFIEPEPDELKRRSGDVRFRYNVCLVISLKSPCVRSIHTYITQGRKKMEVLRGSSVLLITPKSGSVREPRRIRGPR